MRRLPMRRPPMRRLPMRRLPMRRLLLASALLCMPLPGMAAPAPGVAAPAPAGQNGIAVTDAWSRAAMAGRAGVVYLTVTDTGAPDRLTGVSSPVAAKATLHRSIDDHGVMKMRSVAALPVQPGETLKLAPEGYHIMLEGLKQPLQPGRSFPVLLTFAHAGTVTAAVTVQPAGGMPMDHGSMGGSHAADMPGMSMGGTPQH